MRTMTASRMNKMVVFAMALCAAQALVYAAGEALLSNMGFEQGEESWGVWGDGDIKQEYHGVQAH